MSGRWIWGTSLWVAFLLWVLPVYYLWSSAEKQSAKERKAVRRFRRMAEEEEKQEFLRSIAV